MSLSLDDLALVLSQDNAEDAMELLYPNVKAKPSPSITDRMVYLTRQLLVSKSDESAGTNDELAAQVGTDLADLVQYGPEGNARAAPVAALLAASKYGFVKCATALLARHGE
jgi:hypothetical protein